MAAVRKGEGGSGRGNCTGSRSHRMKHTELVYPGWDFCCAGDRPVSHSGDG